MTLSFPAYPDWPCADSCPGSRHQATPAFLQVAVATAAAILAFALATGQASAHATEQGFVLLLPTELYIATGIGAVALTVLALAFIPPRVSRGFFNRMEIPNLRARELVTSLTSAAATLILFALIYAGLEGSHDPLENPLTLVIWTVWWTAFLCVQGVSGDLWRWINPWAGVCNFALGRRADYLALPEWLGAWPGLATLFSFGCFALAYPAPNDPYHLAVAVSGYWIFTFVGMALFGPEAWLSRCECFTMLLRLFAKLAPVRTGIRKAGYGVPGWSIVSAPAATVSLSVFAIAVLAVGSFDGLNETFWWLAKIGVNPLEFPGRSAVINETIAGLTGAIALLTIIFAFCVWLGLLLARTGTAGDHNVSFSEAFGRLSLTILPIAFGYHFAHFLPAFLVNGQYALLAATDPFSTGADYLELGTFYVTTGFFNTQDTVRTILLTQCFAIVIGHMLAVMLAHAVAVDLFGPTRQAAISQVPLAILMILYTLLSLWLLASPRSA